MNGTRVNNSRAAVDDVDPHRLIRKPIGHLSSLDFVKNRSPGWPKWHLRGVLLVCLVDENGLEHGPQLRPFVGYIPNSCTYGKYGTNANERPEAGG